MPGPLAHHPEVRRRRNRRPTAAELTAPEAPKGPTLPKSYVIGFDPRAGEIAREYSDTTRRWWNKIRTSPHAGAYQDVHWEWLLLLAPLFDRWVTLADLDALKELRLQAPPFGLRPADANKMDWTIDPTITGPTRRDDDGGDTSGEPPRSGKGSGKQAWLAYATRELGLQIDDGATRDDIIRAVDERKAGRPARRDPRMTVYDGGAAQTGA